MTTHTHDWRYTEINRTTAWFLYPSFIPIRVCKTCPCVMGSVWRLDRNGHPNAMWEDCPDWTYPSVFDQLIGQFKRLKSRFV